MQPMKTVHQKITSDAIIQAIIPQMCVCAIQVLIQMVGCVSDNPEIEVRFLVSICPVDLKETEETFKETFAG